MPGCVALEQQRRRPAFVNACVSTQADQRLCFSLSWNGGKIAKMAVYRNTCVKRSLKRQNEDLNNNWYLNEGRK